MRKWSNETINNRSFEVNNKDIVLEKAQSYRDINDCYGRCSQTKRNIWNSWLDWFYANDGYCTISSYNCNFFTIEGYFIDKATNQRYFAHITHAHNKAYKVAKEG